MERTEGARRKGGETRREKRRDPHAQVSNPDVHVNNKSETRKDVGERRKGREGEKREGEKESKEQKEKERERGGEEEKERERERRGRRAKSRQTRRERQDHSSWVFQIPF